MAIEQAVRRYPNGVSAQEILRILPAASPSAKCSKSLVVSVPCSALHQIPQQIRRHRQLGERKATGSDLLDRTADARGFRMGREPVLGGLLAGLAGCQHIRDQSSFGGCDLLEGAVDSETFEIVVRRPAACGRD